MASLTNSAQTTLASGPRLSLSPYPVGLWRQEVSLLGIFSSSVLVIQASNLSTQEAEAEGSQVRRDPEQFSEIVPQIGKPVTSPRFRQLPGMVWDLAPSCGSRSPPTLTVSKGAGLGGDLLVFLSSETTCCLPLPGYHITQTPLTSQL